MYQLSELSGGIFVYQYVPISQKKTAIDVIKSIRVIKLPAMRGISAHEKQPQTFFQPGEGEQS